IRMMFKRDRPAKQNQDFSNKYEYNYDYDYGTPSDHATPADEATFNPPPNHSHYTEHTHHHSAENRSGFFGDLYLGHDYWELKPMNISHFIGGTIIDLTKAQIPVGETKLNISAFIGDVKVFVPNDMEVDISVISSSFLGDSTV